MSSEFAFKQTHEEFNKPAINTLRSELKRWLIEIFTLNPFSI